MKRCSRPRLALTQHVFRRDFLKRNSRDCVLEGHLRICALVLHATNSRPLVHASQLVFVSRQLLREIVEAALDGTRNRVRRTARGHLPGRQTEIQRHRVSTSRSLLQRAFQRHHVRVEDLQATAQFFYLLLERLFDVGSF
jgi:hypothetical protein